MKNGAIENMAQQRADIFIKLGYAKKLTRDEAILHAESLGGDAACSGVEFAIHEQRAERAVIAHARTSRSGR
jgi:hypothetical protein